MFNGDTFEEPQARKEAEHYLDRWRKQLQHDTSENENNERRKEASWDYGRAQPTKSDVDFVQDFISGEFARNDVERYKKSQVARKLGLVVAHYFNCGFDAGAASVREENGYLQGFRDAQTQATAAV